MSENWLLTQTAGLSAFIALVATYLARGAANRFQWLDKPGQHKAHSKPIPLLGGIAIYGAFLVTSLIFDSEWFLSEGRYFAIAATLLTCIGLYDDWRGLNPLPKLSAQILAAIASIYGGIYIHLSGICGLDVAFTVFWVVGICNAMNLLDNMDGLSAGVAAIASLYFGAIALSQGQIHAAILAAALLGATLGFLRFNWHPATIFMGDAGSLSIGFAIATLGLMVGFPPEQQHSATWLIPIIVLAVPIFDTTLVTVSRLRRKLRLTDGGRDHTSHRLVTLGLTVRQAVGGIYQVALLCGGAGLLLQLEPTLPLTYAIILGLGISAIVILLLLERADLSDTGQTKAPTTLPVSDCEATNLTPSPHYESSKL